MERSGEERVKLVAVRCAYNAGRAVGVPNRGHSPAFRGVEHQVAVAFADAVHVRSVQRDAHLQELLGEDERRAIEQ